jgi:hypothetical protein
MDNTTIEKTADIIVAELVGSLFAESSNKPVPTQAPTATPKLAKAAAVKEPKPTPANAEKQRVEQIITVPISELDSCCQLCRVRHALPHTPGQSNSRTLPKTASDPRGHHVNYARTKGKSNGLGRSNEQYPSQCRGKHQLRTHLLPDQISEASQ